MRMMMKVVMDVEAANQAISNGTMARLAHPFYLQPLLGFIS